MMVFLNVGLQERDHLTEDMQSTKARQWGTRMKETYGDDETAYAPLYTWTF
jgi:hypothetical protein